MDPLSALSLSCNILDLLDLGIKTGGIIKEMYRAPEGLSKRHEALLDQAATLSTIAAGLQQAGRTIAQNQNPVDARMKDVAAKCSAVRLKIEAVVAKCKAKKTDSVVSATSAAVRILLSRSDVEKLETELKDAFTELSSLVTTKTLYVRYHSSINSFRAVPS